MNCKICNPETDDQNVCEYHARLLRPLQEFLADSEGDVGFLDDHALIQPCGFHPHTANLIWGFIAGAQMKLQFVNGRIQSCDQPAVSFIPEEKWP